MGVMDKFKEDMMKEVEGKIGPVLNQMSQMCEMLGKFSKGMETFMATSGEMNQHLASMDESLKAMRKIMEDDNARKPK
jgi:hypothetical protein